MDEDPMTIERHLDAYRRGALTLAQLLDELPVVSDASPELDELLVELEAGRVPPEVVSAWSHPESDIGRHARYHAYGHGAGGAKESRPAWRFLARQFID
jgi:hypothetical protein